MFDSVWNSYIENNDIKNAVYYLKGKYDNLDVLPLGDFGENVFALSIGSQHNSTILASGVLGISKISLWVLLNFLNELLEAIQTSGLICKFAPAKILETRPMTIIPCVFDSKIPLEERLELTADLCSEWDIKRLYLFENSTDNDEIIFTPTPKSPPHIRLMTEILASSGSCSIRQSNPSDEPLTELFAKIPEKPSFIIKTGSGINPLPVEVIQNKYLELRELLILALMI